MLENLAKYKNEKVNEGMDFKFHGKISQEVLENYLSRAITYSYMDYIADDAARAILNVGAKFVCRTMGNWYPSAGEETEFHIKKAWMDAIHAVDPDIIFEACIFETCGIEMNGIKIPAFVFEAFGKEPEDRCFDYKKMEFQDGTYVNMWCPNHSVPDITQEEWQMFVYYRACRFIDLGLESIHMGQTGLMGRDDPKRECWTKVIRMMREYALKNGRRGYVLFNSHDGSHKIVDTDGNMMVDFNMYPLRLIAPKDAEYHEISEDNPQICVIDLERDAPYKKGISGTSPSGWYAEKYPYLVEIDNYGGKFKGDHPFTVWGYDEISWFANQPDWYRRQFMIDVRKMVADLNENGHVAMPGSRCAYLESLGKMDFYHINTKTDAFPDGFSDEEALIKAFETVKLA